MGEELITSEEYIQAERQQIGKFLSGEKRDGNKIKIDSPKNHQHYLDTLTSKDDEDELVVTRSNNYTSSKGFARAYETTVGDITLVEIQNKDMEIINMFIFAGKASDIPDIYFI